MAHLRALPRSYRYSQDKRLNFVRFNLLTTNEIYELNTVINVVNSLKRWNSAASFKSL